ncbi:VOC family protein [Simkania negevensis]|uniref:VOC domain-containing protein n=1 Tax=Simkania negevensis (strain ATCC VR-1471 / DSM 27360 / Z) TaxID=331113 RepID=F8L3T1_SIMNZ|nr:VOC family protein [Simkania negevensis]CCB89952.1 putative uncharacterized protein [Simkania negevensis Z]
MTTKPKIAKGISLACVTVSDLKKAKHLFVDLLGLDVKEHSEEFKWLELGSEDQEARLGIGEYHEEHSSEYMQAGTNAVVSIEVANVEEAKKYLEENGVEFLNGVLEVPGEIKLAIFKDSDGNRYFLSEKLK